MRIVIIAAVLTIAILPAAAQPLQCFGGVDCPAMGGEIQPDLRLTPYTSNNLYTIQQPTQLQFSMGGKTVFSVSKDGTVTLGEGFTADDASRAIWRQIEFNLRARAQCKEDQK
jgi:hypothetical protein